MRIVARLLIWFGYAWCVGASLFIGACLLAIGLKRGWSAVQECLSPFNKLNVLVTILALSPGFGAIALGEFLKKRGEAKTGVPQ
jgi:divalent metal cation (Fe/Co/Zn/Cd) transporter